MNERGNHDERSAHFYAGKTNKSIALSMKSMAEDLRADGPVPFAEFMAWALYDPELGYYAQPDRQVGKDGDFFTSVSAGPVFGDLLARHMASWALTQDQPVRVVELGAHDGRLAVDVLEALGRHAPQCALEYVIIEPLEALARRQREMTKAHGDRVRVVASAAELTPQPTFIFGNELLDALPFHLVEAHENGWHELGVGVDEDGGFCWKDLGSAPAITGHLPNRPPGYRTEVRPDLKAFFQPLIEVMTTGRMMWIDYGFERDDYYHASRVSGTLRTYAGHRAAEDPLAMPGGQDLTAHVEWTAVREVLERLGGEVIRFETQSRFLTNLARPWLLEMEGSMGSGQAKLLRNFQTLTHPGQLGSRFQVMEAEW